MYEFAYPMGTIFFAVLCVVAIVILIVIWTSCFGYCIKDVNSVDRSANIDPKPSFKQIIFLNCQTVK